MVRKEFSLMSKGSSQAPQPPSIEEVLSDLQNSSSLDVAFQHPGEVCPEVQGLKGHSLPTHGDKENARHELPTQNTGITTGDDLNRGQDEEKYTKVIEFLANYNSLVKSSTALKNCEQDLETQRHELEEKMVQVRESLKTIQK